MSAQQPYDVGQKVHILMTTGQVSTKRFEIVKVWRYPTTFRYLLDTGYVADHWSCARRRPRWSTPSRRPTRARAMRDAALGVLLVLAVAGFVYWQIRRGVRRRKRR